jgi:hypothetical protein
MRRTGQIFYFKEAPTLLLIQPCLKACLFVSNVLFSAAYPPLTADS